MSQIESRKRSRMESLSKAQGRFLEYWHELIRDGEMLHHSVFLERSGFTSAERACAEAEKRVFAVTGPDGNAYYPAFLCNRRLAGNFPFVLREIADFMDLEKWMFFRRPQWKLGQRVIPPFLEHVKSRG